MQDQTTPAARPHTTTLAGHGGHPPLRFFSDHDRDAAIRASLSRIDADMAAAKARRAAMTADELEREYIDGQREMIRSTIVAIRLHRDFRRRLATYNPSALGFYHDEEPALALDLRRRWVSHRDATSRRRARG